jgi:hypothetical protein
LGLCNSSERLIIINAIELFVAFDDLSSFESSDSVINFAFEFIHLFALKDTDPKLGIWAFNPLPRFVFE